MPTAAHSMIRVLDEARSLAFYRTAFALEPVGRASFDTFTLVYLANRASPFELELTVNHDRTQPYALGDGYGHLAFTVDDVAAEHARLSGAGLAPGKLVEMLHEGVLFARFFFLTDPDGYRIEVIQKAGRFR